MGRRGVVDVPVFRRLWCGGARRARTIAPTGRDNKAQEPSSQGASDRAPAGWSAARPATPKPPKNRNVNDSPTPHREDTASRLRTTQAQQSGAQRRTPKRWRETKTPSHQELEHEPHARNGQPKQSKHPQLVRDLGFQNRTVYEYMLAVSGTKQKGRQNGNIIIRDYFLNSDTELWGSN